MAPINIAPRDSVRIGVPYTTGGTTGNGSIQFSVQVNFGGYTTYAIRSIQVVDKLGVVTGGGLLSYQSPALATANGFAKVYAHSTVPYITRDAAHSITLVHNSDRASPYPLVGVDLSFPNYSLSATTFELSAVRTGGAALTFTNGETTLRFQGKLGGDSITFPSYCVPPTPPSACIQTTHRDSVGRLYGRLDMRSEPTGIVPVTLTLVIHYSNGTSDTKTYSVYLLNVNDGVTPFVTGIPKGWEVAGLQRLYSGNGYMAVEGGGTVTRFASAGGAQATDFSTLTTITGGFARTYLDGTKILFNATGLETAEVTTFGDTTKFSYDANGRLTGIEDPQRTWHPGGPYQQLTYDANGYLATVQDGGVSPAYVRITHYAVTTGLLTRITDVDGNHADFSYDGNGRLITILDRKGARYDATYSSISGKLLTDSLPSVPIDSGAGGTQLGRPVMQYALWANTGVPSTSTATTRAPVILRDTTGDRITDPIGRITKVIPDVWGQAYITTNPQGSVTTVFRNGFYPKVIKAYDGSIDSVIYTNGLLTAKKAAGGSWAYYHYGVFGQVDSTWGAATVTQRLFLQSTTGRVDSARVTRITDSVTVLHPVIRYTYDAQNRVISHMDESGHVDSTLYDSVSGNMRQTWTPGGVRASRWFDVYGRDSAVTVTGQPTVITAYDGMNRVTSINDGVNATATLFVYDPLFRRSVYDAKNQRADSVDVDALGHTVTRYDTFNSAVKQTYRYDAAGQLTSTTNRRGQRVDRTYDAAGRLATRTYGPGPTVDTYSHSASVDYTAASNALSSVGVSVNRTTGQQQTTVTLNGHAYYITHWATTNFAGRDSVSITTTTGPSTVAQWATQYNLYTGLPMWTQQFRDPYQTETYNHFTIDGRPTSLTYSTTNGPWSGSVGYTSRGAVIGTGISGRFIANQLFQSVQRDTLDRIRATLLNGKSVVYAYDGLGRLVTDSTATAAPFISPGVPDSAFGRIGRYSTPVVTTFSYDAAGNRTDNGGSYGAGNRVLSFKGYTFVHDSDGNVTRKYNGSGVDVRYSWDELGRLVKVKAATNDSVQYDYDALDRLIRRITNGVVDQYWLWDGDQLVAELTSSFSTQAAFRHTGTDHPEQGYYNSPTSGYSPVYADVDTRGNVIGWVNVSGFAAQTVSYDAWGVPTSSGDDVSSLRWKGLHWEGGVAHGGGGRGAYYMRARWYDPELGRFLSEDPLGVNGGLNLYMFGRNDPVNMQDPQGLKVCFKGIVSAGVQNAEDATHGSIIVKDDCVEHFSRQGNSKAYREIQDQFEKLVNAPETYYFDWSTARDLDPEFSGETFTTTIGPYPKPSRYPAMVDGRCTDEAVSVSPQQLFVHELYHAFATYQLIHNGIVINDDGEEIGAVKNENIYNRANHLPSRCKY